MIEYFFLENKGTTYIFSYQINHMTCIFWTGNLSDIYKTDFYPVDPEINSKSNLEDISLICI